MRSLLSPLALLLWGGAARAQDASPDELWLATDQVALGLAADGSLTNSSQGLGLRFDPDGPLGEYPAGGDAILPGRAFEVWSITSANLGTWVMGAPDQGSDLTLRWDSPVDDGVLTWIHGDATVEDAFALELWIIVPWGQPVVWMVAELDALADLGVVSVARVYDPDQDFWLSASYNTENRAGEGYVVGSGAADGRAWALAATGGVGGICSWCTTPAAIFDSTTETSSGDSQLGVALALGDLGSGERAQATLAYAFAIDADSAVALAQDAAASEDLDGDGIRRADDCDDLDAFNTCDETGDSGDDPGAADPEREGWDVLFEEPSTTRLVEDGGSEETQGGCASTAAPASPLHLLWLLPAAAVALTRRS